MPLAQRAVDLGKETIRFMTSMNNTSNLYRRNQVFYHQFLTSAIAVLFLASTHAPLQFSSQCRAEFYMALELVKDMSARSLVSQRLWRTVRSLKAYAPRLGLGEEDVDPDPRRSGAAMAMAGLASGTIGGGGGGQQSPALPPLPPVPAGRTSSSSLGVGGRSASSASSSNQFSTAALPSSQQQQQQQHVMSGKGDERDDNNDDNGQRLGTEMKAIFENYTCPGDRRRRVPMPLGHLHAGGPLTPGAAAVVGVGSPTLGTDADGVAGVYPIVRDLF